MYDRASDTVPVIDAVAITPSDTVNIAPGLCRSIWVGYGGDVTVITARGSVATFKNVPSGSLLPVQASRVNLTGTTASSMLALF